MQRTSASSRSRPTSTASLPRPNGRRGSRPTTTTCAQRSTGCSRTTPTPHSASWARSAGSGSRAGSCARAPGACLPPSPLPARPAPLARVRARRTARWWRGWTTRPWHRGARRGGRALARARRPRRAGVGARQPRLAARVRRRGRRSCARGVRGEPGTQARARRRGGGDSCARRHRPGARRDGRDGARGGDLPRPPRGVGRRSPHGALRVPLPRRLRADPRRPGVGWRTLPREPAGRSPPRRRRRDELRGARRGDVGGGAGDPRRALVLAASVEALWESLGLSFSVRFWDGLLERYLGPAREQLGEEADAAWAEGRALAFDEAIALALGGDPPP